MFPKSKESSPSPRSKPRTESALYSRDIPNIFYQSMQTRVDELSQDKHVNMVYVEYLDAVARVADKAGLDQEAERNIQILKEMREDHKLKTGTLGDDEDELGEQYGFTKRVKPMTEAKLKKLRRKNE